MPDILITVLLLFIAVGVWGILERLEDADPNRSHAEWINGKWNRRQ